MFLYVGLLGFAFPYFCYGINFQKLSKHFYKTNTPYTRKQPLMMAYEWSESARDNFGKFIDQFQPETKTLIRKLERIINIYISHLLYFILSNQRSVGILYHIILC